MAAPTITWHDPLTLRVLVDAAGGDLDAVVLPLTETPDYVTGWDLHAGGLVFNGRPLLEIRAHLAGD